MKGIPILINFAILLSPSLKCYSLMEHLLPYLSLGIVNLV